MSTRFFRVRISTSGRCSRGWARARALARTMPRGSVFVAAVAAALAAIASPGLAQCQYEVYAVIESLPCPPFGTQMPLRAQALNSHGHVVGYWEDCDQGGHEHGFIWKPETGVVELPKPPGITGILPSDINDHGTICGTWNHSGVGRRGFVYWPDTQTYTELDTKSGSGWSMAHAINNRDVVVGERSIGPDVAPRNAFVWSIRRRFTDIGYPMYDSSFATGISDDGTVVGGIKSINSIFKWRNGVLALLGNAPITSGIDHVAIGQHADPTLAAIARAPAAGNSLHRPHAVMWDEAGELLPLLPTHNVSGAWAMRHRPLQVVGYSRALNAPGVANEIRGVMWAAGEVYDLNDLIDIGGWTIQEIGDINSNGQLLAFFTGAPGVLLLSPVEPSAGDIDGDCDADVHDLVFMLHEWGESNTAANVDDVGVVNVLDLLYLLSHWTGE